jgi:hypothetical protein
MGDGVGRLFQVQLIQQRLEAVAVFGKVDGVRRGPEDRHARRFQRRRQLQRGLAAILDDHAQQLALCSFGLDQLQHVFGGQRFEIEPVGGVVVGGDGFGVAVDHDGLNAHLFEREGGVAAAIVKLDALADPVRAAAQDDRLLAVRGRAFAFAAALIGRIHVGGGRGELGRTGVHALVDRAHAQVLRSDLHFGLLALARRAETRASEKPMDLSFKQFSRPAAGPACGLFFGMHDGFDLAQEPGLIQADRMDSLHAQPSRKAWAITIRRRSGVGLRHGASTIDGARRLAFGLVQAVDLDLVKAGQPGFQAAQGFLHAFGKAAAHGHGFAHRFHRGGQKWLGAGDTSRRRSAGSW